MLLQMERVRQLYIYTLTSLLLGAGLSLQSCSSQGMANQALDFNNTIQKHRVEQLFLNVIRASQREPMAITTINTLQTINRHGVGTGSVGFSFGPGYSGPYSASPSADISSNATLGIGILDNDQKFMKAFQTGVPAESLKYFVHEGWNPQMLIYMFVESISFPDKRALGEFIQRVEMENPAPPTPIRHRPLGQLLAEIRPNTDGSVILENDPWSEYYELFNVIATNLTEEPAFETMDCDKPVFTGSMRDVQRYVETFPGKYETRQNEDGSLSICRPKEAIKLLAQGGGSASIKLRSPQGVLYYLGELARIQLYEDDLKDGRYAAVPVIRGKPLFLVQRVIGKGAGMDVTVKHQGVSYGIPKGTSSRSMSALSLVSQLILLQPAEVAPTATTLQVIGN